jgi:hypothetical protein
MRVAPLMIFAMVLSVSGPALAQDWDVYTNTGDGFKVDFPGQPKITTTTFKSEYGAQLPTHIYSATSGAGKYSVTVVDYTNAPKLLDEHAATTCPKDYADERSCGLTNAGRGYWKEDMFGAVTYATFQMIQRNAKVTHLAFAWQDLISGNELQLVNADQSLTFAFIAMHKDKLYITEATVPKGYPPPGLFQQSMGWVDANGNGVRYQSIYSDMYAEHPDAFPGVPKLTGQGRGAGPGAGAGAGAGNGAPGRQ